MDAVVWMGLGGALFGLGVALRHAVFAIIRRAEWKREVTENVRRIRDDVSSLALRLGWVERDAEARKKDLLKWMEQDRLEHEKRYALLNEHIDYVRGSLSEDIGASLEEKVAEHEASFHADELKRRELQRSLQDKQEQAAMKAEAV